jgi:hypothetical protein
MSDWGVALRVLAAFGALALGAVAIVIVAVLAHRTPGPAGATNTPTTATTASSPAPSSAFPAPPDGAVVFSRPYGGNVLALGVVPGNPLKLQASVLGGQGNGVDGKEISFRLGSRTIAATPCGAGCYAATASVDGAPKAVDVRVAGAEPLAWRVPLPKQWPPPDASDLVARATTTYKALRTLAIDDRLASGPGNAVHTRWTIVAPNRLSYQVANGASGVIVGNRRWDKVPGQKWTQSEQTPIHQPTPFWISWKDAHILGETKSAWRVSFFDPKTPGWYELLIAKRSMHTLEMQMHATAHFMREVFGRFNDPLEVVPPLKKAPSPS